MKRGLLKLSKNLLNIVLVLLLILSLATVGLIAASYFVEDLGEMSFAYAFIGEFLHPVEFLVNEAIGKFNAETLKIIYICVGAAIALICLFSIVQFSKIGKKNPDGGKKNSGIKTFLLSLVLWAYSALNIYYLFTQFMVLKRFINKNTTGLIKETLKGSCGEVILYKGMTICGLIALFAFMIFVLNFFDRNPLYIKNKRVEEKKNHINFYSEVYIGENQKRMVNTEINEEVKQEESIDANKKKVSEDLVNKVMQLNKLRDNGQITEVEYTKLRQKAIRRYRG